MNGLKRDGYDDDEIDFMLQRQPQLAGYVPSESAGRTTIEGQTAADTTPAPRRSWFDRAIGRRPAPAQPAPQDAQGQPDAATVAAVIAAIQRGEVAAPVTVSNSTHDTQPPIGHELYEQSRGQGQGNGPAAPRIGGADTRNPTSRQ